MTMVETEEVVAQPLSAAAAKPDPSTPVRVQGKFFFVGDKKHFVKGVTYGPFPNGGHGAQFPEYAVVDADFARAEAVAETRRGCTYEIFDISRAGVWPWNQLLREDFFETGFRPEVTRELAHCVVNENAVGLKTLPY